MSMHETPRNPRSPASASPIGPAPTINTGVYICSLQECVFVLRSGGLNPWLDRFFPIQTELAQGWNVVDLEQHRRRVVRAVDVLVHGPWRNRHEVASPPFEGRAVDNGRAGSLHHVIDHAPRVTMRLRVNARPQ